MSKPRRVSGPTVAELCRRLPANLLPVVPAEPVDEPISAVHISELRDPTPYLEGHELLLTTGLTLPRRLPACREYVARLRRVGVSALAFGIGPVHETLPPALPRACGEEGMALLQVPDETPFLTITRAFWESVSSADQRHLHVELGAHRRLIDAAASAEPVAELLRGLADALGGWAGLLSPSGNQRAVWPPEQSGRISRAQGEINRLRVAGLRSAATFPLDDEDVVVHPLAAAERVVGFLVSGAPHSMTPADRHVVLTARALLGLEASHRRQAQAAVYAGAGAVARLVEAAQLSAARLLAVELGVEFPSPSVRIVVVGALEGTAALSAVADAWPDQSGRWIGAGEDDGAWILLRAAARPPDLDRLRASLTAADPSARALVGPVGELGEVRVMRARLQAELLAQPLGSVEMRTSWAPTAWQPATASATWAPELIQPLVGYRRADLVGAVTAYLRHRGHWERASRELGIHRNTLRYRIDRANSVLQRDLDDTDTAAQLWLALRASGHA